MSSRAKLNFFLAILIFLVFFAWRQRPEPNLKLVFCSVGQGDATLIIWQNQQVLVDGGPNNRVLDCLGRHLPFWDRKIEAVIASHAEADHITGLIGVAERYDIGEFLAVNEVNDTAEYRALATALNSKKIRAKELMKGASAGVGPIKLSWLWPQKRGSDDLAWAAGPADPKVLGAKTSLNESSQVILMSFGNFDALLTGDIDTKTEVRLAAPEIEVLKVAHHGSKYSTGKEFLQTVKPELAVISVGKNSYGHPTREVLDRLEAAGSQIRRTDAGDVVIISDGVNWRLE